MASWQANPKVCLSPSLQPLDYKFSHHACLALLNWFYVFQDVLYFEAMFGYVYLYVGVCLTAVPVEAGKGI